MKNRHLSWRQKFVEHLNEKAFTMIEALLALSVFSVIAFFLTPILQIMLTGIDANTKTQEMEWEVACSQLKKEIRLSSSASVVSGRLYLTEGSDTITYEKYSNYVRRRVNSTGNEILLQNVGQVTFTLLKNAVKINVKDIWGNDYSMTAFSLLNWNSVP